MLTLIYRPDKNCERFKIKFKNLVDKKCILLIN